MNKREKLFEIFDNFMDNKYKGDNTVEDMFLIIIYPGCRWECPVRRDPNRDHFYNYYTKAFSEDLEVMNYTDRHDLITGKPNKKHRIVGVRITYKDNTSDVIQLGIDLGVI